MYRLKVMLSRVTSLCDKMAVILTVLNKSSSVARRTAEQGEKRVSSVQYYSGVDSQKS